MLRTLNTARRSISPSGQHEFYSSWRLTVLQSLECPRCPQPASPSSHMSFCSMPGFQLACFCTRSLLVLTTPSQWAEALEACAQFPLFGTPLVSPLAVSANNKSDSKDASDMPGAFHSPTDGATSFDTLRDCTLKAQQQSSMGIKEFTRFEGVEIGTRNISQGIASSHLFIFISCIPTSRMRSSYFLNLKKNLIY